MALISLPRAPLHYDVRDQSELRRLIEFLSNQVEQLLTATGATVSGGGSLTVDDEGVAQGTATTLDFVGAGVTASVAGDVATVTISGGGSGVDTEDEGVFIGTATTLDFVGSGVTASFGAGTTTVTIPSGGTVTETEVDFGATPVYTAQFAVVDAAIGAGSKVLISESGKAAAGRVAGDAEWDSIAVAALPAAGTMTVYATAHPGPVVGKRKLHYLVAT